MVNQKQMCAERKTLIYLKFFFHAPKTFFSLPKSHRWFNTHKTSGEDGGSEGQLNFVISDIVHSPIVILFPLHQPAPASTSPGLP